MDHLNLLPGLTPLNKSSLTWRPCMPTPTSRHLCSGVLIQSCMPLPVCDYAQHTGQHACCYDIPGMEKGTSLCWKVRPQWLPIPIPVILAVPLTAALLHQEWCNSAKITRTCYRKKKILLFLPLMCHTQTPVSKNSPSFLMRSGAFCFVPFMPQSQEMTDKWGYNIHREAGRGEKGQE